MRFIWYHSVMEAASMPNVVKTVERHSLSTAALIRDYATLHRISSEWTIESAVELLALLSAPYRNGSGSDM